MTAASRQNFAAAVPSMDTLVRGMVGAMTNPVAVLRGMVGLMTDPAAMVREMAGIMTNPLNALSLGERLLSGDPKRGKMS